MAEKSVQNATDKLQKFLAGFKSALEKFEESGHTKELLHFFSNDAVCSALTRPHAHQVSASHASRPLSNHETAERFWREYHTAFREIRSEFKNELTQFNSGSGHATLEWESRGVLSNGMPVHYAGVTLLEIKDEKIFAMRTYFDSAALLPHGDHAHRS